MEENRDGHELATAKDWLALATLLLPVLLVSIDGTVVNLALPMISLDFGSSGTLLLWIIDSYSLVLAGLLVPMGSFADRFGRRRMLLIGATGFSIVSALAAFSPNGYYLVAARAAMGLFGAMLMPSTLSLIRNIFHDRNQRRTALAIWAAGFSAGAALGPVVGGILLQYFHWNSVFLMALPILIPMLVLTPIFVPESRDPHPGPVSIVSIFLSIGTLAPLVYAIKTFATEGAVISAFVGVGVAVICGYFFGRIQLRSQTPMLDLRLFSFAPFTGSVLTNLLIVFSLAGFLYYSSQHLQLVVGLDPLSAGLTLLPGTVVMIISGLGVVPIARRFRINKIIFVTMLCSSASYFLLVPFGKGASAFVIGAIFCLEALGSGAAETLTNDAIVSAVPPQKAGAASAISETAYEVGAVLGTAILGSVLVASYRSAIVLPPALSEVEADLAKETLGGAIKAAETLPKVEASALLQSAHAAFDSGVVILGLVGGVVMAFAAVMALLVLRHGNADLS